MTIYLKIQSQIDDIIDNLNDKKSKPESATMNEEGTNALIPPVQAMKLTALNSLDSIFLMLKFECCYGCCKSFFYSKNCISIHRRN